MRIMRWRDNDEWRVMAYPSRIQQKIHKIIIGDCSVEKYVHTTHSVDSTKRIVDDECHARKIDRKLCIALGIVVKPQPQPQRL